MVTNLLKFISFPENSLFPEKTGVNWNVKFRKKRSKNKSSHIIKAHAPRRREVLTMRLLILSGVISMVFFLTWFYNNVEIGYSWLYWPLTIALMFKIMRMVHEWYHYFSLSVPKPPVTNKVWTVDVLTTACPGEPYDMFDKTLRAMAAIKYPHTNYLCDEGNDPALKKLCDELGIIHVTRTEKKNAKAGNINNALKQATGELCVVMDPDHIPCPDFLDRVVAYFEDPKIGYVQVVQGYYNQGESFVARGAAEQTYHFYGPMMMCMNTYGTAQAIGANCTFRRTAIDSIGGHAAGLSEDMHTAMRIHSKGWKSIYVPEMLTKGLVPATLPGYYKQQLKWARGTFELLFEVFPKICKNFTWRQNIHYFTLPMYYLFGLINFIDIIVPGIALLLSKTPWRVEVDNFVLMFTPLFGMSMIIRQYAQNWLIEKQERGLHITGGLLRMGTWWIFLTGFVYSIFRINVPYIPTPKNDEPVNNVKLSLPNLAACLLLIGCIVYGLNRDWSPYSLCMAGFAAINAGILGFMVIIGQEKLLNEIEAKIKGVRPVNFIAILSKKIIGRTMDLVYMLIRRGSLILASLVIFFLMSYTVNHKYAVSDFNNTPMALKSTGGFYTGIYIPQLDKTQDFSLVEEMGKSLNTSFDIVSVYQAWGPKSIEEFPDKLLKKIVTDGGVPMITWEPWAVTFPEFKNHPDLQYDRKICKAIHDGLFDNYLKAYAQKIRKFGEPIFLRFAHEPDNPAYPWSPKGGNTPEEFIAAHQHVVALFEQQGVSNVSWVFTPWSPEGVSTYFPGGKYVNWVGLTTLNYGYASFDKKWRSFNEIYEMFRKKVLELKCPVMLAEFGTTAYGGDRQEWLDNAFYSIANDFKEIKALVFFNSDKDKNWITPWRPDNKTNFIDWTFHKEESTRSIVSETLDDSPFSDKPLKDKGMIYPTDFKKNDTYKSKFIKGKQGKFKFMVNGKPFYVKGVAYNTQHDWRDGNTPLSRSQLTEDFTRIKAMGANTIRRYEPGTYDENILNIAHEFDLKVIYGFWFDPEVDYLDNTSKVEKYISEVEEMVTKYKNHPSVLAWNIGNETWGILKHHYSKPYLTKLRKEYVKMIEYMAQRIHKIDPTRPVLSSVEHEEYQLPGEIAAFHDGAPSLDMMGINSYYEEQISTLKDVFVKFEKKRPYLVSEFGAKGYWDPKYSRIKRDAIIEDNDEEKSKYYARQWKNYIKKNAGNNIGGVTFCWKDRLEGSSTWFGITDYKGRIKPTYYYLQNEWSGACKECAISKAEIKAKAKAFLPGKQYVFTANAVSTKKLHYEWSFNRAEYLEKIENIKPGENKNEIIVTIPEAPSNYRLYLYASDDDGNVSTASLPIPVK